MIIYPPRNLPPAATPWGRAIENRQRTVNTDQSLNRSAFDNFNRATSSALAVNASSLNELSNRRQVPVNFSNLLQTVLVPASSSVTTGTSQTITLSSPDGEDRSALLFISGNFVQTPEPSGFSNTGFELSGGGSMLRRSGFAPVSVSAPPGWTESFIGSVRMVIGLNTSLTARFQSLVTNVLFPAAAQSFTVGVSDISCTVVFGEKV